MTRQFLEWSSRQMFRAILHKRLVYNTCWEDPRLDREAMVLTPRDRIAMITSAGCNALDYVLDEPERVDCIDMNPAQNALLDLKIASIRALDYERFFQLFGRGYLEDFDRVYRRELRPFLPESARMHWDRHPHYFRGRGIRDSFYFRGASGVFAHWMGQYLSMRSLREATLEVFSASSIEEQRQLYNRIRHAFWTRWLREVIQWDGVLALVGVPRPQRKQIDEEYPGGISRFIEDCVDSVFTRLSLRDNYFWWLYLAGSYTPDRCPEYLKEKNFQRLKAGLIDRIHTHTGSLLDFFRNPPGPISRFVLLDHMDWLTGNLQSVLQAEWQALVDCAAPGAKVLWRSGGLRSNFVDDIPVQVGGEDTRLGDLLIYQTELARSLHARDRVHTYGSFAIADLAVH
jgi:S-adenosylmethionine-diacylglycerol 3-amino-3-carboxypropyl transferase